MNKKLVGCALAIFAYALINSAHAAPVPLVSGLVNGDSVVNDPNYQKAWANTLGKVVITSPYWPTPSFFNTVDSYINQLNAEQYGGVTGWRLPGGLELRNLFGYSLGNPDQHVFTYSSPSGAVTNWGPIQKANSYWLAESRLTPENGSLPFVVFGYNTTGDSIGGTNAFIDCPCRDWIPGELGIGQTFSILAVRDGLVSGIPVPTFTVGGTVSGLASGKTVVLKNNNNTVLVSSTSPSFTFPAQNEGTSWNVSVALQPSGQTCTVTNGSGTNIINNITNVSVDCVNTYTVSGSISGLTGTLVLRMGTVSLVVGSGKTSFKFATGLKTGVGYNVAVALQPPGLSCSVSSGLGTISSSDVTNVSVTCVNTYTVSGTISGLTASGLTLKLTYTPVGGTPLTSTRAVSSGATSFAFSNGLKNGSAYQLDVIGQPTGLTCLVLNGLGNINSANVTDISIFCTPTTYTISGTTDGTTVLASGSTVSNTVTTNAGSYSLSAKYGDVVTLSASKTGYSNCIVAASPITVTSDTTANVSGCTANKYRVGGTITDAPLVNGGQIGLTINGNLYTFTSNGSFSFPVDLVSGNTYDVRVGGLYSFPSNWAYKCIVSNGVGSVTSSDVTNVQISCDPNLARPYPFYLSIGGLKYSNTVALGLHTSGPLGVKDQSYSFSGSDLKIESNLYFFTNAHIWPGIVYATSYQFSILSQPLGQTCSISRGSGTLLYDLGSTGLIVGPAITCSPYYWSVSGQITGYSNSGSGLLGLTLTDLTSGSVVSTLSSITDGSTSFDFKSNIQAGHAWGVTVTNQPTNLSCFVVSGTGTNINNDVTSVSIQCQPITYTVSGSISGLTASGLSLSLSGSKSDSVSPASGATSYTFTQTLVNGNSYTVTISAQPTGQTCTLSPNPATGTVGTTNVVVDVTCTVNTYTIAVTNSSGATVYISGSTATNVINSNSATSFSFAANYGDNVRLSAGKVDNICSISPAIITAIVSNAIVSVTCLIDANYYMVTTLAGSGLAGYVDGTVTAASFNHPAGVAVDSAGNVYVADTDNNLIRKIALTGVVTTLAGSGVSGYADDTGTAASFNHPAGVAVDSAGNVYVADTDNNRIRKITPNGVVSTLAGGSYGGYADGTGSMAKFANPRGVAIDSAGNVYVADTYNNRIRKIALTGVVTTLAGSGNFDSLNGTGTYASFANPTGVAVDNAGNVFVTERASIRKITSVGLVSTLAGRYVGYADGPSAMFSSPNGVALDSVGRVYVADTYNQRIRMSTSEGVVSTLAGSGAYSFADGVGTNASFNAPSGVAIDTEGNLYVADRWNNRIRKISGSIKTYAIGDGGPAGGIVFYTTDGGKHGLEVGPVDLGPAGFATDEYCSHHVITPNNYIGAGRSNTDTIIYQCGTNNAAYVAKSYMLNGYNDWYLPSYDELQLIFNNKNLISGFCAMNFSWNDWYWSSSDHDLADSDAIALHCDPTIQYAVNKGIGFALRPVRNF